MLLLLSILLLAFCVILVLLFPVLWGREIYHQYSEPRAVTCPENGQQVSVTIGAAHVVATELAGAAKFRLTDCTRWPAQIRCNQACLPQAIATEPYTKGEVHLPKSHRQIFHLPVLLAAFAAWYLGMLWHSQYLFRARWMADLGLTPEQVKQLVAWYSPHLVTVAACLLFAYGVAWLQTWFERKGIWRTIGLSLLLWAVIFLAALPSTRGLPRDLLLIESSYTLIASVLVGFVIAALRGRLVLPQSTARES